MNITNIPSESTTFNEFNQVDDEFFTFEKLSKNELVEISKKLNDLCLEYNPYTNDISDSSLLIIKELKLEDSLSNPFTFTNVILQMLDKVENLLKTKNI